ncbi:MAG: MMPL family transporter [Candidatus Thermoplasmatota archaeon]|nr:MMPL family transporter [Candidatus Thermoplasmatota archaeon]
MDEGSEGGRFSASVIADSVSKRVREKTDSFRSAVSDIDSESVSKAIRRAPVTIKRNLLDSTVTDIITKVPAVTVVLCLAVTGFFSIHSGINDCRDGYNPDWCSDEGALNVNGDMAIYLPQGSEVQAQIEDVEQDWTTNVMVVYVESNTTGVDKLPILSQLDLVENTLNTHRNDNGEEDFVIYVLSVSTVVKEVNSSGGRVIKAFFSGIAEATGNSDVSQLVNETVDEQANLIGDYSIPDEQERVDQILDEMPQNALDKLVRDVGKNQNETAGYWNRAVIIIGITSLVDMDGDGEDDTGDYIEFVSNEINRISIENNWVCRDESGRELNPEKKENEDYCEDQNYLDLRMTLTGPVPLTNAITEESFKLFWGVFPVGVILVAFGLFIFHCDLLQTGRIRLVQGIKVVIISGLPTLCSVWITLGMIGLTDYEVTMTVIIVGPIVLALGVSYGLHITNRYAESKGSPREKMAEALSSTGRAVLLSALTTIIGFISLTLVPMKPIQTIGWALSGGIVVVYLMTMLMVPNLTMMLDLKKPSHPPPKIFQVAVETPIKWTRVTLAIFTIAMLVSAGINRPNVEENIDLLEMAPGGVDAVDKMGVYSDEFNAGQPGFLLITGDISADPNPLPNAEAEQSDPYANLEGISQLETKCNSVENTTAVSIVFLMKAIGVGVNVTGTPIYDLINGTVGDVLPEPIREVSELIFDNEQSGNVSFWSAMNYLDLQDTGGVQAQNFLIYVFYNSMTDEMRGLFMSSDYKRSLIYIDMPFMDVKATSEAVELVDEYASQETDGAIDSTPLIGVASITIEVNNLIVGSQWSSLGFALLFTVLTLALVFRDVRYAMLTTMPVGFTVMMQWLAMDGLDVPLSLVTVMIGSILVGVGVDFSIHIANRIKEQGGTIEAIQTACASTGMSLFEAVTVTAFGMTCAYLIPIAAIKPFVTTIIILLLVAAISALILLPAIFTAMIKANIGLTGGVNTMVRTAGLRRAIARDEADVIDAAMVFGSSDDAW